MLEFYIPVGVRFIAYFHFHKLTSTKFIRAKAQLDFYIEKENEKILRKRKNTLIQQNEIRWYILKNPPHKLAIMRWEGAPVWRNEDTKEPTREKSWSLPSRKLVRTTQWGKTFVVSFRRPKGRARTRTLVNMAYISSKYKIMRCPF